MQQTCQTSMTKNGDRRRCKRPAMPGGRFCASHQDVPCATTGRLWWCFRVHAWRMFSPSFAPRVKKLTRDLPPTLGRADRDVLRLLSCLRQWTGRRDDVQAAIERAAKLERVHLWAGQLHLFGREEGVPLSHHGARPKTTLGGTYRPGAHLSPVTLCQNSHAKSSTPLQGSFVKNSGPLVQGRNFKGGTGG